jgi:hypothetical protein
MLDYLFDDKRAATALLVVWMVIVCGTLQTLDLLHSDFMTCGPSPHTRFMTVAIDTWPRWWLLASATFANTCVTDFMSDAIAPWLQNTMQDHKTRFLPYSKLTCYIISQTWAIHCSIMALFSVALIMSQIDFLLIRVGADLLVNTFTAFKFMRNKTTDSHRYSMWFDEEEEEAAEMDGGYSHAPHHPHQAIAAAAASSSLSASVPSSNAHHDAPRKGGHAANGACLVRDRDEEKQHGAGGEEGCDRVARRAYPDRGAKDSNPAENVPAMPPHTVFTIGGEHGRGEEDDDDDDVLLNSLDLP